MRERADAGLGQELHALALGQYDRVIGLELEDVAVDGCTTKAPCGGEKAGRSPVDRGKQGLKSSTATDASGIPLALVAAGANRPDAPLLGSTLAGLHQSDWRHAGTTVNLDRGYDGTPTRTHLADLGLTGAIARRVRPAPIQAGTRCVVERTQSWRNGFGKLRRCTERAGPVVDFYLSLAASFVVVRRLIQRARKRYRWENWPTTRRLK